MKLKNPGAEIFVPDGKSQEEALKRTTHMGIGTHPDDLEIMSYHGILECFGREDRWFTGVVVTDGAGSPRDNLYAHYTDENMKKVRKQEQKKAAVMGEYSAAVMLFYPSSKVKDPLCKDAERELGELIAAAGPSVIYTHNPADKHETHVAVCLRAISAIRGLPKDLKPKHVYGCEVWRDLDWMLDEDKIALDVSGHENLGASLLGIFDSQVSGGKRYDLATTGRRRAHATYHATHGTDTTTGLTFAMDLMPLCIDDGLDINEYVTAYIKRFSADVSAKLKRLS